MRIRKTNQARQRKKKEHEEPKTIKLIQKSNEEEQYQTLDQKKERNKMKRSLLKNIGVVAAGVVMSLAMGTAAFAADTSMTIEKEIAFFNPQSAIEINYPAVEYTYSIAPVNPGAATVNDGTSTVTVKQGVAGGVTMASDSTASFKAGSVAASQTGVLLKDTFGIQVDLTKFAAAGVYRYALTEAAPENLAALGYEMATESVGTRYLDVYIINGENGREVQSMILFYGSETTSLSEANASAKTSGFVSEAGETDYSNDGYVDKYKTYNVDISKTVTGGLGDKTNLFPINASVTAGASASDIVIPASVKTNTSGTANAANITLASGAAADAVVANLADGDIAQFIGIPVGSTLNISETNNTADTYQVTTEGLDPALTNASVEAGATSAAGSVTATAVEAKAVGFTNNLDQISPTNVVLRFAPYLFILGAAILLLLVMRRRKSNDDE